MSSCAVCDAQLQPALELLAKVNRYPCSRIVLGCIKFWLESEGNVSTLIDIKYYYNQRWIWLIAVGKVSTSMCQLANMGDTD